MRKLTATAFAVAAVISAGAGASAALAAGAPQSRPAAEHVSVDRHTTQAQRDRSGIRDSRSSTRHDSLQQRATERTHGTEAGN